MNGPRVRNSVVETGRLQRRAPVQCGMSLFDTHGQRLGAVISVRDDYFVMFQDLGIDQLVAVPMAAVAGIVGSLVLLTLTPGEIELFCHVLLPRARKSAAHAYSA